MHRAADARSVSPAEADDPRAVVIPEAEHVASALVASAAVDESVPRAGREGGPVSLRKIEEDGSSVPSAGAR